MYLCLRNNTYHFRFVIPPEYRERFGKREIRQTLHTGNKREAQRQAIMLAAKVYSDLEEQPVSAPTLRKVFASYIHEKQLQGLRSQTIHIKKVAIKRLLAIADKGLSEYTRADAKLFRTRVLAEGKAIGTFNNQCKHINAFWHWAIAEGYTTSSPFEKLLVRDERKPSEIGKVYSTHQLKQLFAGELDKNTYKYLLPLLALYTGARLKESIQENECGNEIRELLKDYKIMARKYDQATDIFKQEARADLWDKLRLLIFRSATAIAIGSIILGVSYISVRLQIPLPLLRTGI